MTRVPLFWILLVLVSVSGDSSWAQGEAPKTALELFESGGAAYAKGDYEGAKEAFTQFLTDFGEAEEAKQAVAQVRPLLAICSIRTRAFDEAREAIDQALAMPEIVDELKLELQFWKGVCALQAADYSEAQETFGAYYKEAPKSDPRRQEAAVLFGTGYVLQDQHDAAIDFFKARLAGLEASSSEIAGRFMTLLLHALLETDRLEEALELTNSAAKDFDQFVQIIGLQSLMLKLGSSLLDKEQYYAAIQCLRHVWEKERLITFQMERQKRLEQRIKTLKARGNADALVFQLDGLLTRIKRELAQFEKVAHYDAALRMRVARAYLGLQRYREAGLIMEAMLASMAPSPIVEQATVSLIQCWMQTERWAKAVASADLYFTRFGREKATAPSAPLVLFMKAQAFQSARDDAAALLVFEECIESYPKASTTPQAFFMRGICQLQLDKHDEAITIFKAVPVTYPKQEALIESALYWQAMAHSFANRPAECLKLIDRHLKEHPDGYYHIDARFRQAYSLHVLADYDSAIPAFRRLIEAHPDSPYVDEARLLLGDGHLALGDIDDGIAAYAVISPESTRFFEDGYFKTGKALRASERYDEMQSHFESFLSEHEASTRLPEAVHWLAWLEQKDGKLEAARARYWAAVDQFGPDEDKTSMIDLILGLTKLYRGPLERDHLGDLWDEKQRQASSTKQAILAARSYWGKAQALKEHKPAQATAILMDLSLELNPEVHSARLLIDSGDAHRSLGDLDIAEELYRGIIKWHPNALERDRADAGLGFIAMKQAR